MPRRLVRQSTPPSHLLLRALARQHLCTLIYNGHSLAHTGTRLSTSSAIKRTKV